MLFRALKWIVLASGLALLLLAAVLAAPVLRDSAALEALGDLRGARLGAVQDTTSQGGLTALRERNRTTDDCSGILCTRQDVGGGTTVLGIADALRNSRSSGTSAGGGARFVTPPKR